MAAVQKYKVNNMAKDLDKKTKEIVELLKDKGFDGKSSSSVMENTEINLVLNHYITKSEVSDIASYLATPRPMPKREAAPAEPAEKAEAAKAPEAKPESKPEARSEARSEAKPQETAAPKSEAPAAPKPEAKPAAEPTAAKPAERANTPHTEHRDTRPNGRDNRDNGFRRNDRPNGYAQGSQNAQNNQNGYNRPDRFGDRRSGPNAQTGATGQNRPFEKRPYDPQRKPYTPGQNGARPYGQNQNAGGQMTDRQIERQINKIQREGAQLLKQEGIRPEKMEPYSRYDKNERFDKYTNVKFTKDGFVSEPSTNQQKPSKPRFSKPAPGQGMRDRDEDSQSVRQPSLKPVFDKDGRIKSRYAGERKEGVAPAADSDGVVRVVDIRTS